MQFSTLFLAAAAATLASAVKLTNADFAVTAGSPFNITWADAEGPVTLLLKNGPSTSLTTVSTIGSGLTGTSYSWTPSSSLDSSLYAIEIQDSTNTPNYSQQFQVSGATAVASTVTASSTSASSASGSSTSGSSTSGTSTSGTSTGSSTGSSSTASSTSESSTSNGTSTSASSSPTASGNSSTTLSGSSSASRTSSSSSRTASSSSTGGTSTATSAPTSAAAEFASPLAFIFLAFAAIVTLN
ncbi:hypothetical protein BCIN_02g02210 [Botrytis cinerea B05.10]|uniref:Yeast cell wall synthesis Kre9/Knh1-like N-terminal domain-containing protein n=3 Tax=Botryotinia fuckeliana TaxID=40559 RepID=A0A384J8D2_BOTFB|nr:hypothetical protein BCIN_02g02210 [Botrytis cinerea B05.10]XP_024546950.1 hypothetical protein BCIN_02g02210 [Botrytis cinerea B05.10]EMR85051.1 putative extracellular matrix protein [Botrytis cinerea BcDW1]CCD48575.1 hypothetical protein BofuT4_P109590.1 [Botrytis cinerea T4]ATZ46875.1 hypothetical protein BCIN_02g02210 [Botrytis cinerea B05.10]ATZ46876.1 hypothetical protein BCIN_02g02210 [Botrytis cinerea B05.10]